MLQNVKNLYNAIYHIISLSYTKTELLLCHLFRYGVDFSKYDVYFAEKLKKINFNTFKKDISTSILMKPTFHIVKISTFYKFLQLNYNSKINVLESAIDQRLEREHCIRLKN